MSQQELNPKTKHYEFLGPPGAFLISIGVPITAYSLYFGCSEATGYLSISGTSIFHALTSLGWWKGLWDTQATIAYFAWYAFCVLAWVILPGDVVTGTQLRNGGRKLYKINGTTLNSFVLTSLDFLSSIFDFPPCPRYRIWNYCAVRSGVVYIHLLQMGGTPHCCAVYVPLASNILLYLLIQTW
jgi:hypothetical protein